MGDSWEKIEVTVDSGAADHVSNDKVGHGVTIRETEASKRGMNYRVANGAPIPNRGETVLRGVTDDGTPLGFTAQITDVTKTLCSVSKMVSAGNRVVFDDAEGNYIMNKKTGHKTYMEKHNGVYKVTMWRQIEGTSPSEQAASSFQRPGK